MSIFRLSVAHCVSEPECKESCSAPRSLVRRAAYLYIFKIETFSISTLGHTSALWREYIRRGERGMFIVGDGLAQSGKWMSSRRVVG